MGSGKKRILVVDDCADLLDGLLEAFEGMGYEVVTLGNGIQASHRLDQERFDALVVDINLPGMNGLQTVANARLSKLNRDLPVFVMSGSIGKQEVTRAAVLKVNKLVAKPFDVAEFAATVRAAVEERSGRGYDVRIINCFLEALTEVLSHYLGAAPTLGRPTVKKDPTSVGLVSGMIGFTGETLNGSMAISFGKEFVERLAKAIFMGQDVQLDDRMIADLSGEMANQLCGKVKIGFAKLGLKIKIGLPKVVLGEGHRVIHKTSSPVLAISVKVDQIEALLEFAMEAGTGEPEVVEETKVEPVQDVILFD